VPTVKYTVLVAFSFPERQLRHRFSKVRAAPLKCTPPRPIYPCHPIQDLPSFSVSLDMGVIFSAVLVAQNSIKKSRDKKKAKRNSPQEVATASSQPFAHSQTQDIDVEGLRDEHLASIHPPTVGTDLEGAGIGQAERNIAVEAPLPIAAVS
jgi:hypothetical protein